MNWQHQPTNQPKKNKWLVVEARKLSDAIQAKSSSSSRSDRGTDPSQRTPSTRTNHEDDDNNTAIVHALDAMGYEEAAQYIYGIAYPDWKERYGKPVATATMDKFHASKPLWARHPKDRLLKRTTVTTATTTTTTTKATSCTNTHPNPNQNKSSNSNSNSNSNNDTARNTVSLLSNVCCEDIDNLNRITTQQQQQQQQQQSSPAKQQSSNTLRTASATTTRASSFLPPVPPKGTISLGVLTISDRAFAGDYEQDLSGPAVIETIQSLLKQYHDQDAVVITIPRLETAIVPDEVEDIKQQLLRWSDDGTRIPTSPVRSGECDAEEKEERREAVDLIVTTGGTGFALRDVTPEATVAVVDRTCEGLMSFCLVQCVTQQLQPLAALSRGTAGVKNRTLILNLPGNPQAVQELLPIILPLAFMAIADMKKE